MREDRAYGCGRQTHQAEVYDMEPGRIAAEQARAARLLLGWTQREVAERVSITISCVCEAEHGNKSDIIAARLRACYEAVGIEFTAGSIGVRLQKDGDRRNIP
jgi:transcriptional regulator with XRE-family HTH domain